MSSANFFGVSLPGVIFSRIATRETALRLHLNERSLANTRRLLLNQTCFGADFQRKGRLILPIVVAMLLDAVLGDPKTIPHPVVLVGTIISFWERVLYTGGRMRAKGVIFCSAVALTAGGAVFLALKLAAALHPYIYDVLNVYLLFTALACRSLKDEAMSVADALAGGGVPLARARLSGIVGRDTSSLLEDGIARATIETVAESYIDGVVSVLFYMTAGSFFGCESLFAWLFKTVSTMDSMVGYDNARYKNFGLAAARLDDALNFIPARLGAVLAIAAASFSKYDYRRAVRIFIRDRLKHKSPNSAHGESVFAGLLGISLGGGAYYDGEFEARPWLGEGLRAPGLPDIWSACDILDRAYMLCMLAVLIVTGCIYV